MSLWPSQSMFRPVELERTTCATAALLKRSGEANSVRSATISVVTTIGYVSNPKACAAAPTSMRSVELMRPPALLSEKCGNETPESLCANLVTESMWLGLVIHGMTRRLAAAWSPAAAAPQSRHGAARRAMRIICRRRRAVRAGYVCIRLS